MFTISQEQKQYLTYILTDEAAKIQIEVVPERGGIITRWRDEDHEILYLDEARYADPTKTIRGGIPILFPTARVVCSPSPDTRARPNPLSFNFFTVVKASGRSVSPKTNIAASRPSIPRYT